MVSFVNFIPFISRYLKQNHSSDTISSIEKANYEKVKPKPEKTEKKFKFHYSNKGHD